MPSTVSEPTPAPSPAQTAVPASPTAEEATTVATLTLADRGDCCSAAAHVRTRIAGHASALLWCAHHFRKNEPALAIAGAVIEIDQRERLTQPLVSANVD